MLLRCGGHCSRALQGCLPRCCCVSMVLCSCSVRSLPTLRCSASARQSGIEMLRRQLLCCMSASACCCWGGTCCAEVAPSGALSCELALCWLRSLSTRTPLCTAVAPARPVLALVAPLQQLADGDGGAPMLQSLRAAFCRNEMLQRVQCALSLHRKWRAAVQYRPRGC